MKRTFNFGKIDYYGRGRKINLVEVEADFLMMASLLHQQLFGILNTQIAFMAVNA